MKLLWRIALGIHVLTSASIAMDPLKANIGSMGVRRALSALPKHALSHDRIWQSYRHKAYHHRPFEIIHPCTDYGFKYALKSPDIAMGFINHTLNLKGPEKVKNITYIDPHLPSEDAIGRNLTVDVLCDTDQGKFLVEMQNNFLEDYSDKAFVELCRLVGNWDSESIPLSIKTDGRKQLRAGKKYSEVGEFWKSIKKAVVLVVSNRQFKPASKKRSNLDLTQMEPNVVNTYRMGHDNYPDLFLGEMDARVVLVMLGNFKKQEHELKSEMDRWLYLFKDESLRYGVSKIPTFKPVHSFSQVASSNKALQHFYKMLDSKSIPASALARHKEEIEAVNTILEQQKVEGKEEGLKEGKIEIAKALINEGMKDDLIVRTTGLTLDQVQGLRRGETIQ